ncbi:hypothetical protein OG948_58930 (plasmid) [Embleya sp. NBC_00888]|uniref:DUF6884 domain-containing protein n=1 Tax=Embleya sp. NBC_00888 TaxID=2975960 RepID=UPI002F91639C|nr:hypothetical protein OG948_58930 [Embleya sp. NBC_00888]
MAADPTRVADGLVIVACCREKRVTSGPVPALDLYEGWVVPLIRDRIARPGGPRERVLVLSALYGLITADTPVTTYEQPMTDERQHVLGTTAPRALRRHLARHPTSQALLLMISSYARVLGPVPVSTTLLITDPMRRHDDIHTVLDSWNWP